MQSDSEEDHKKAAEGTAPATTRPGARHLTIASIAVPWAGYMMAPSQGSSSTFQENHISTRADFKMATAPPLTRGSHGAVVWKEITAGDEEEEDLPPVDDSKEEDPPSPDDNEEGGARLLRLRAAWNKKQYESPSRRVLSRATTVYTGSNAQRPPPKTHEDLVRDHSLHWAPLWTQDDDEDMRSGEHAVNSFGDVAFLVDPYDNYDFIVYSREGGGRTHKLSLKTRYHPFCFPYFEPHGRDWVLSGYRKGAEDEYHLKVDSEGRASDAFPTFAKWQFKLRPIPTGLTTSPCGQFAALWARGKVTLFQRYEFEEVE